MKKLVIVLIVYLGVFNAFAQQKTQVLVLGSYHMSNPGLDAFNMESDDVTSPKRKKEVEDFVNLLARFKPTKICVEAALEREKAINEEYKAYVNGTYELTRNEIDQVAYRLAKQLGHDGLYAIDVKAPFDMDTVVKVAQIYQIKPFMSLLQSMPAFMEKENQLLNESTITSFFMHINTDAYNQFAHDLYLKMALVGQEDNYAGADLVADWYKRNLRIYRNLMAIDLKPDDRVLVLYGAGHNKILQDLVDDTGSLELVKLSSLK